MDGCSPEFVGVSGQIVSGNVLQVGTNAYVSGQLWITGSDGAPLQITGNGSSATPFSCSDMDGCSPEFVGVSGQIVSGESVKAGSISGSSLVVSGSSPQIDVYGQSDQFIYLRHSSGVAGIGTSESTDVFSVFAPEGVDIDIGYRYGGSPGELVKVVDIDGHVLPGFSGTQNLGSSSKPWNDIYLKNSSIYMDDSKISLKTGNLSIQVGSQEQTIASMAVVDVNSNNYTLLPSDNGKALHIAPGNSENVTIVLPVGDTDFDNFKCNVRHVDDNVPYIGFKTSDDSAVEASATGFNSKWAWGTLYRGENEWYLFGNPLRNDVPVTTTPAPVTTTPVPVTTTPAPTTPPPTTTPDPSPEVIEDGLMVRLFGWNDAAYTDNEDFVEDASINPGDGSASTYDVYKSTYALPNGARVSGVLNNMTPENPTDQYIQTVTDSAHGVAKKCIEIDGINDFISMPQLQDNVNGEFDSQMNFLQGNSADDTEYGFTVCMWIKPSADIQASSFDGKAWHIGAVNDNRSVGLYHDLLPSALRPALIRGNITNSVYSNALTNPPSAWDELYNQNSWCWMALTYNGGPLTATSSAGTSQNVSIAIGTGDPSDPSNRSMTFYSGDGSTLGYTDDLNVQGNTLAGKGRTSASWVVLNLPADTFVANIGRPTNTSDYYPGYFSDYRIYNRDLSTGECFRIFTGNGNV